MLEGNLCLVLIPIIVFIVGLLLFRIRTKNDTRSRMLKLNGNFEKNEFRPIADIEWLDQIDKKYTTKDFSIWQNEYTEAQAFVLENSKWDGNDQIWIETLHELNDIQKSCWAIAIFESQVDNGGLYQFLFNYPELSLAALQGMKLAKLEKLEKDYEIVLKQYFANLDKTNFYKKIFRNASKEWNERWGAFQKGAKDLSKSKIIENYFYNKDYRLEHSRIMLNFIKLNQEYLVRRENS